MLFTSFLSNRGKAQLELVNCICGASLAKRGTIGVLTALAACIRPPSQDNKILACLMIERLVKTKFSRTVENIA